MECSVAACGEILDGICADSTEISIFADLVAFRIVGVGLEREAPRKIIGVQGGEAPLTATDAAIRQAEANQAGFEGVDAGVGPAVANFLAAHVAAEISATPEDVARLV